MVDVVDPKFRFSERIRNPVNAFDIIATLGKGSFGAVYHAREKTTGLDIAIKKLTVVGEADLVGVVKEIEVMKTSHSPFIVAYYDNFFKKDEIWILMELMSHGSLTDMLTVRRAPFTEDQIAAAAHAILSGLVYLHKARKIHRDVKPQNILVGAEGIPKLADFGIAGQLSGAKTKTDTMIGTPYFLAPEIIMNEFGYNDKVDVWATGISCIQLAEMNPPLADVNPMRALLLITQSPSPTLRKPDSFSSVFNDFITQSLIKDATKRPRSYEIIDHPFIRDRRNPHAILELTVDINQGKRKYRQTEEMAAKVAEVVAGAAPIPEVDLSAPEPSPSSSEASSRGGSRVTSSAAKTPKRGSSGPPKRTPPPPGASGKSGPPARSPPAPGGGGDDGGDWNNFQKSMGAAAIGVPASSARSSSSSKAKNRKSKTTSRRPPSSEDESDSDSSSAPPPPPPSDDEEDQRMRAAAAATRRAAVATGARNGKHGAGPAAPKTERPISPRRKMTADAPSGSGPAKATPTCASCAGAIVGKHMVVGRLRWHKQHFVCTQCKTQLTGDSFELHEDQLYCEAHFHQMFSPVCAGCKDYITAGGVATALGKTWHPEHFVCTHCSSAFSSSRFIAKGNMPFCDKQCYSDFAHTDAGRAALGKSKKADRSTLTSSAPPQQMSAPRSSAGSASGHRSPHHAPPPMQAATLGGGRSRTSTVVAKVTKQPRPNYNRLTYFKKAYIAASEEAKLRTNGEFLEYIDRCRAAAEPPGKLAALDLSRYNWNVKTLLAVGKAFLAASTYSPEGGNQDDDPFGENMAISELDLSHNNLGHDACGALQVLLSSSFPLKRILLAGNRLGKRGATELADALARRKSLVDLDLSDNLIGDKGLQCIADKLGELKSNMRMFDVTNCDLGAGSAAPLMRLLDRQADLEVLNLGSNKLGDKGLNAIAPALEAHIALREVDLSENQIKSGVVIAKWIASNAEARQGFGVNTFLEKLSLAYNYLGTDFAVPFAPVLASSVCPVEVNLTLNKLNAKASVSLLSQLPGARRLEELYLEGAEINTVSAKSIADALANPRSTLRRLSLRKCGLSKKEMQVIAEALGSAQAIESLDFALNKLADTAATALFNAVSVNQSLVELNVAACQLSRKSMAVVAAAIAAATPLRVLHLDANPSLFNRDNFGTLATALVENRGELEVLTLKSVEMKVKDATEFLTKLPDNLGLLELDLQANNLEKLDPVLQGKFTQCQVQTS
jgi:serine/threonine kinase 3